MAGFGGHCIILTRYWMLVMSNNIGLIAQASLPKKEEKKEAQLCLKCQFAPRRASVEELQPSGLMWSHAKGSAVCCSLLFHLASLLTHTPTHTRTDTPIFQSAEKHEGSK